MRFLRLTLIVALSFSAIHADAARGEKKEKKQRTTASAKKKNKKPELSDTYWHLIELDGKAVTQGNTEAYLFMHKDKLTGNTGCNDITGKYSDSRRDESLKFEAATTEMACLNGMDTENTFKRVLTGTTRYKVNGDHLLLYNDNILLAIFEAKSI
jgi:heat shock protein HslJ